MIIFQDFILIRSPESVNDIVTKSQTVIQGVKMNSRLILRFN